MKKIFMHIPKNGGKTLNSILNRFYPEDKTFAISEISPSRSNIEEFINLKAEERLHLKILRGHMIFGMHKYFLGESEYFTLLRRPEDRVVSFYYFVLRNPDHRLHNQVRNLSLTEFVQRINPPDLNNGQIRFLSGINDKEEFMLEKAFENIEKHFAFVGTVEKFDESLIFLKLLFAWPYPFYTIRNQNDERKKLEELPRGTLEIIKEFNQGDVILYEKIAGQLDIKIQKSIVAKGHLNVFQSLNKLYSTPLGKKIIKKIYYTKTLNGFQKKEILDK